MFWNDQNDVNRESVVILVRAQRRAKESPESFWISSSETASWPCTKIKWRLSKWV